jgi:hypothetical protein
MAKAAFLLALVAALLSGWLAFERYGGCAACRAHDAHEVTPAASTADERVAALEKRLAAIEARPALADLGAGAAGAPHAAGASLSRSGPATGSEADLERRLAKLEDETKRIHASLAPEGVPLPAVGDEPPAPDHGITFSGPTYLSNPDEAAKHLDLTPSQKVDLERIAADAKRRIEDLKKIPDEEGKTWEDAEKASVEADGGTGLRVLFGDSGKVRAFREKTIPGRGESFGAAERKIVDDAKSQIRSRLDANQQAKWDKAKTDGLVGGSSGDAGFAVMFSSDVVTVPTKPDPAK